MMTLAAPHVSCFDWFIFVETDRFSETKYFHNIVYYTKQLRLYLRNEIQTHHCRVPLKPHVFASFQ